MNFLHRVAKDILRQSKGSPDNYCLVFPNKRAVLFMTEFLKQEMDGPGWMPEMLTIEEFVYKHSMLAEADPLIVNITLYRCFVKYMDSGEQFDQFFSWGNMLMKDFDELDKYMVDARNLFTVLLQEREIISDLSYLTEEQVEVIRRFWASFTPPDYSENQTSFLKIWEVLLDVYEDVKTALRNLGVGYQGMIYREVAEKARKKEVTTDPYEKICFIGFNMLTESEIILFHHLQKSGKVLFYWDVDKYYVDNEYHEAGRFLRQYIKRFPPAIPPSDQLLSGKKEIIVAGIPLQAGQARYIASEISDHDFAPLQTAIVLPDEGLLFPVIDAVRGVVENINITMGYAVRNTHAYTLINDWMELQRYLRTSEMGVSVYYKPLFRFLSNPVFRPLYGDIIDEFVETCKKDNVLYVTEKELDERLYFLKHLFVSPRTETDYCEQLVAFTAMFLEMEESSVQQDFLFMIHLELKKLSGLLAAYPIPMNRDTLFRIIRQYIKNLKVPFSGEPLNGIQIMGLLETRNLDFDTVFMTDVNEGILPADTHQASFIPYHLRKGFGMPTSENQDAMYAYYFYRLLQNAGKVYLMYNTQSEGNRKSERSRFILQLQHESGFDIKFIRQSQPFVQPDSVPVTISKSPDIQEILKRYTSSAEKPVALSPSALNTYLECRLKFYYRYIAGIDEPVKLIEEMDAAVFGNLVHYAMEAIYRQYAKITGSFMVKKADFGMLSAGIDEAIGSAFCEVFRLSAVPEYKGDQLIVRNVIKTYIQQILKVDEVYAPFEIIDMEGKSTSWFRVQGHEVLVGGRVDRMDSKSGVLRIVDYKTGTADKKREFNSVESLFERENEKRNGYAFQVLLYSMVVSELAAKRGESVQPGLLFIRETMGRETDTRLFFKEDKTSVPVNDYAPYRAEFEEQMQLALQDLFDPDVSFSQVENLNMCEWCPYKNLCNR